jgi:PAS domain S-box
MNRGLFKKDKKNIIAYSKLLEGIISGIPDIIKVYNTDQTIEFYNDVGYSFYNKIPEEVKGKKCYEVLGGKERCDDCPFEKAMETKKMVITEKYIPELNRYMDICCNPVLNESGEVVLIVERLRDITEKKILDNMLKENEERYRQIINASPDAMIITEDSKIALVNNEAINLIGIDYDELKGKSIFNYIPKKFIKPIRKRLRYICAHKKIKDTYELSINCTSQRSMDLQISSSYIDYKGRPAVLSAIRDITDTKKGLNEAAELQKKTLQKCFPVPEKVRLEISYVPCKTVSGDFFRFYKVNDDLVIGILIDVSGKGIAASLSISAFDVLFNQEVLINHKPIDIVNNLNKKIGNYLGENYVAVCCFSMDFKENKATIVGAGINEFILKKGSSNIVEKRVIEGTFLGMFEDSIFDERVIYFEKNDRFYFFTDGLDFILDDDKIVQNYMGKVGIDKFKSYIDEFLNDTVIETGTLKDDCTLLALEIM